MRAMLMIVAVFIIAVVGVAAIRPSKTIHRLQIRRPTATFATLVSPPPVSTNDDAKKAPAFNYGLEILRQRERLVKEKQASSLLAAAKPQPPIEHRPLHTAAVPTVADIEARVQSNAEAPTNALYHSRSGGYPDLALKNDIYTLLYATQVKSLKDIAARAAEQRSYIKPGTLSEDVEVFKGL
jgi:hypothetical protein